MLIKIIVVIDRDANISRDLIEESNRYLETDVIHSIGTGISDALNTGIHYADTELIARLDADDRMLPNRIARQVSTFNQNSKLVLCGSGVFLIAKSGLRIGESRNPKNHKAILEELTRRTAFCHPSVMYKKSACIAAGLYNSSYDTAEDYEFWTRLVQVGEAINLSELLTEYRLHDDQVSNLNSSKQAKMAMEVRNLYSKNSLYRKRRSRVNARSLESEESDPYNSFMNLLRTGKYSKRQAKILMALFHPIMSVKIVYRKFNHSSG
jgi:glycosyltransferase involved in cell wall biosynthesis